MSEARIGEHEDRLDICELAIHLRHREFVVEVDARAQPLHQDSDVLLGQIVDEQTGPSVDADVGQIGTVLLDQRDAFVDAEQAMFVGIDHDENHDLVEGRRRTFDDVPMSPGERIEGTWNHCAAHGVNLPISTRVSP